MAPQPTNMLVVVNAYKRAFKRAAVALLRGLLVYAEIELEEPRTACPSQSDWNTILNYMRAALLKVRDGRKERIRAIRIAERSQLDVRGPRAEDIVRVCAFPDWWVQYPDERLISSLIQVRNELVHQAPLQSMSSAHVQELWLDLRRVFLKLAKATHNPHCVQDIEAALDSEPISPTSSAASEEVLKHLLRLPPLYKASLKAGEASATPTSTDDDARAWEDVTRVCSTLMQVGGSDFESVNAAPAGTVAALLLLSLVQQTQVKQPNGTGSGRVGSEPEAERQGAKSVIRTFADLAHDEQLPLLAALKAEVARSPALVSLLMHPHAHAALAAHPAASRYLAVGLDRAPKAASGIGTILHALSSATQRVRSSAATCSWWQPDQAGSGLWADNEVVVVDTLASTESVHSSTTEHVRGLVDVLEAVLRGYLGEGRMSDRKRRSLPPMLRDAACEQFKAQGLGGGTHAWVVSVLTQAALLAMDTGDSLLGRAVARALRTLVRDEEASLHLATPCAEGMGTSAAAPGTVAMAPLQILCSRLEEAVTLHKQSLAALKTELRADTKERGVAAEDAGELITQVGQGVAAQAVQSMQHTRCVLAHVRMVYSLCVRAMLPSTFQVVGHGGAAVLQRLQLDGDGIIPLLCISSKERWARLQQEEHACMAYAPVPQPTEPVPADAEQLEEELLGRLHRVAMGPEGGLGGLAMDAEEAKPQDRDGLAMLKTGDMVPMGGLHKRGGSTIPRVCDAYGRVLLYTPTNDLVNTLRLHVALWAPGRVKLQVILQATAAASGPADDPAEKLMDILTASTVESLHMDVLHWLSSEEEGGALGVPAASLPGSAAKAQGGKKAKKSKVGMGTAQIRHQTLEAFFTDRGSHSEDRYHFLMDLPLVAHARARPVPAAWRARLQSNAISVGPQRQVPDAFKFARALAIIRANMAAYDRVERHGLSQSQARPATSAPAAGRRGGKGGGGGAAAMPAVQAVDATPAAVARACKDAAVTILYEDSDASYRPSVGT